MDMWLKPPNALAETAPKSISVPEPRSLADPVIPVWQLESLAEPAPELPEEPLTLDSDESTDSIPKTELSGEAVFSFH